MTASSSTQLRERALALAAIVSLALIASPALAGEPGVPKLRREVIFHIAEGSLESALIQFSRQAEMQVVLAPDSATRTRVSPVHGRFAASDALAALLKGTGLTYTAIGNTITVTLQKRAPAPPEQGGAGDEGE